jgi:superfamily I DNA/RNA helicase
MELTQEQLDIINSTGNIKINAVAGSGKTTTVIEYAKARPKNCKILYLAFNKSVKLEAIKKFAENGLKNVQVETAHSLAYKHIVYRNGFKVRPQGYKTHEIAELLGLQGNEEKQTEYILANHINKLITYYCNSDKQKVKELNYLDVVFESKAKLFVKTFYSYIEKQTRILLDKMNKGEIEISHDFYLKKFQLSNPVLYYDYILFDEGQDASPAMLDIFFKQNATKVIVGDTHQQIYGWRFAVNSLEKADYRTYNLSASFRFSQDIADLAMKILELKNIIADFTPIRITGKGTAKDNKTKATLARTNLGLLVKAIEYVTEKRNVKNIYFEGNINSYTYADEGTSLYDVLNLFNGNHHLIRDKLIQGMKDIGELEDYIDNTEDVQLRMMVDLVLEYEDEIPRIIKRIKDKHIDNDDKSKAEMIFSTVHRSKGMEYDSINLAEDFITEEKLLKQINNPDKDENSLTRLNEEINLLYVAVTRTKYLIQIPKSMLPYDFPCSPHIHISGSSSENSKPDIPNEKVEKQNIKFSVTPAPKPKIKLKKAEKQYSYDEVRENHKKAYKPWTMELDDELTNMFYDGRNIKKIAEYFGRTIGAIESRIRKLGLDDDE